MAFWAACVVRSAALAAIGAIIIAIAAGCGGGGEESSLGVKSEVVVPQANFAVALAVAPDGRIFYDEQYSGSIRVVSADGQLFEQPFASVASDFLATIELGLTGLALDPDFATNHYVYIYYTKRTGNETATPVVVRYTERNNVGTDRKVLIDDLPETVATAYFNASANIHFGPDGYLYVAVGDYDQGDVAQDLASGQGKFLRIDASTGEAAPDNPFIDEADADPRVFAYGLRKVYDFAFNPESDKIYAPDANADTCDELNIIEAGKNYGWPMSYEFRFSSCTEGQPTPGFYWFAHEGLKPVDHLSVVNPTGVEFVSVGKYPTVGDGLLLSQRASKKMRRLVLQGPALNQVANADVVVKDCAFDIAAAPDGTIYYSTDTEIRRLVPVEQ